MLDSVERQRLIEEYLDDLLRSDASPAKVNGTIAVIAEALGISKVNACDRLLRQLQNVVDGDPDKRNHLLAALRDRYCHLV